MESEKNLEEINKAKTSTEVAKKLEKKKNKISRRSTILKKLRCFGSADYGYPTVDEVDGNGNVDMQSASTDKKHSPTHLVVMVNGLIGSAHNWRYAAKQLLKKYPDDLIVHCSERNSSLLTFNGVDVMGNRLANEVVSVIKRHGNVEKISFIGHSLGGLVSRYAIAKLYSRTQEEEEEDSRIGGLVPINFITVATPHLGTGGHRQVPMFGGSNTVEKVAHQISWVLGRTGRHLFLSDKPHAHGQPQPPLLLQMVNDSQDLNFLSALQSFRRHVVYANAHFDHIVGWSTSSIRRRNELPQRKNLVRSGKYPHILKGGTTTTNATTQRETSMKLQANNYKAATASMEEAMMRGLTKISWERIDVSFKGSKQRYFAHNTIQVNTPWINSDGADIIQHLVDNFQL